MEDEENENKDKIEVEDNFEVFEEEKVQIRGLTEIKEVDSECHSASSDDKIEDAVKFQLANFLQDSNNGQHSKEFVKPAGVANSMIIGAGNMSGDDAHKNKFVPKLGNKEMKLLTREI